MKQLDSHIDVIFEDDSRIEYRQDYQEVINLYLYRARTVLLVIFCFLPILYQILLRQDIHLFSPTGILWDIFVYLIPSWLIDVIENHINPIRISNLVLNRRPRTHAAKSVAMRRILNLDSSRSLDGSVSQTKSKRLSINNAVAQGNDTIPAGLGNWDNSCYQNSVLQGLASLKSLHEYLNSPIAEQKRDDDEKHQTKMTEALRNLLRELNDPINNGRIMWTPSSLKYMSSWQQQDAQEYFSKVLDEIEKEINKSAATAQRIDGFNLTSTNSMFQDKVSSKVYRNPLEGLIAQRVGCLTCGFSEGLSLLPFNCLTLPLGRSRDYDISDCLDEYSKLELIEDVECVKCTLITGQHLLIDLIKRIKDSPDNKITLKQSSERLAAMDRAIENNDYEDKTLLTKCKITSKNRVTSTKTRQAVIARPPKSLVVHFNRSLYDEVSGDLQKNCCKVRFPNKLDLGPWCLGSHGESFKDLSREEWIMKPNWPMVASSSESSRQTGPIYELRAVVTHYGRHENGHYVCYKKYPVTGSQDHHDGWWRLSDDEVMKVSQENVLNQGGVFMLFYDCIEPARQRFCEFQLSDATKSEKASTSNENHFSPLHHDNSHFKDEIPCNATFAASVPLPFISDDELLEINAEKRSSSSSLAEPDEKHYDYQKEPKNEYFAVDLDASLQYEKWDADSSDKSNSNNREKEIIPPRSPLVMV
ncbi:Ubiquitin carboxyl-terminal hydrolase 27 [Golovinomyces cichoracearum]|uniref:ubiquitinyl hydrolase 1 n=1 Tax=Golovinomyces cichoracearum TaxID=62708 RepID=A0A420I7E3_9PEZI|nr:Ubiquitin carboxyl-terminal hydrolase 27 [Golovinomyces cichoracearum]